MTENAQLRPLAHHLARTSRLSASEAERLILEVISYFGETPEAFVIRRHQELKQLPGMANERIYERIGSELGSRLFAAPALTRRQIRRMIYG